MSDKFVVSTNEIGGMMSDCDNCIHTHYIDNEWYCLMGNRPSKECKDYRHWNGLTDEEKKQCKP